MTDTLTCKAADKCHWPRGPVQPVHRFETKDCSGNVRRFKYCVSCRAHRAQTRAKYRASAKPRRRRTVQNLPSIADLSAERREELRRWQLSLIIRRDQIDPLPQR